ncbi:ABC transporter substrate-binding protein [Pseudorhodoplanes sinuspersici]|uniref:ABC transporter substrate-binding protein n=1 Tax=Pseudorhodoplanes sinuspersici TaxID=1235591 RepID=A0A1W6ZM21_9HYPH|nr:ABC transporter substrate-binding protein [Pseudorhodoplanes sinuspersici]ARP97814.1 ABC transporter substrate-binding protein [Pseudorhodoplanes sinuspersici]RKE68458.1 carbohydrate ABC transporter substrate-binding protein (CUT1 family) [Pseudorhodoplanes sinuspersici]
MNILSKSLIGLALSGCVVTPLAAQPVEITLAHPYGKIFRPIHEQIIAEFNKVHPDVKVVIEAPQPDYEQLVQRTLSGISQKNAPVISFQGVNQVRQFVDAKQAVDLSPFVKDDPRWKDKGYYQQMMALGRFGDRQMAIPFAISTPIMYFNADLFRKAGLDPNNPPKTWPEVIAAAKKIQSTVPNATGLFYDYQITGNWGFQVLVYSEGGSMMSADETDVAFDKEPGLRAAKLLRSFVDEGVMKDWNRAQGEQAFIAGNVGFYFSSTSWLKGVEDKARFDMRTAFYPESSTGQRRLPSGGNAAVIITDDPKKAKAAYEYAMFAAGPIGTEIMVKGSGYMPMHEEGTARLAKFYAENPNFKTSVEQVPFIFTWYAFPGQNTLKIIDVIKDNLQSIVSKQATPEAALKNAADQVKKLTHGS